jgi:hypothetical protein
MLIGPHLSAYIQVVGCAFRCGYAPTARPKYSNYKDSFCGIGGHPLRQFLNRVQLPDFGGCKPPANVSPLLGF